MLIFIAIQSFTPCKRLVSKFDERLYGFAIVLIAFKYQHLAEFIDFRVCQVLQWHSRIVS
jgi:hypothetical protein